MQVASKEFKTLNWTKLHNVRELTLSNCASLVEVFDLGGTNTRKGDPTTHYPLQEMTLYHLPKLSHIWKSNMTEVLSFHKLTNIDVSDCNNLKSLFSHSMARSLVQLQKLRVVDCEMMEEIITKEEENINKGSKFKTLLPKLEQLSFNGLPKLECVCSGDYDYDIPLYTFGEDEEINIDNNKVQVSFPQLNSLKFYKVPNLKCFCSGAYDCDIMVSSTEECPNMKTFLNGNVFVSTPKLDMVVWDSMYLHRFRDLNLTIHYAHNFEIYKVHI